MAGFTITLPPATQAKIDGLIDDLRTAVQKVSALADTLDQAVPQIQGDVSHVAAAISAEIPQLQASIQEIADAAKKFRVL
jgi:ABC-type transporter Mla subunit MlaD